MGEPEESAELVGPERAGPGPCSEGGGGGGGGGADVKVSAGAGCMAVQSLQALQRLREDRLLCDAMVRAQDGLAFPVHRAILSASSSYFL